MDKPLRIDTGMLLAAMPDMMDPNFMHSVIVVCQHTPEGAHGLVVNRPTEFTLGDLLPEHPELEGSTFPVYLGGPVDHTTMQFLHRAPADIPGGISLTDSLWLGGELDAMARFVKHEPRRAASELRILLGYSGWGEGQLDAELALGSWIPAACVEDAIFGPPGEGAWRRVVRSIGAAGEELGNHPPDVSWN